MGQYIDENNNEVVDQYAMFEQVINDIKLTYNDYLKILFFSSDNSDYYVSFKFPIDNFDQDMFKAIEEYARQDMIIRNRNNEKIGDITRLVFCDKNETFLNKSFDLKHDKEFLESLEDTKTIKF